jgi:transposase
MASPPSHVEALLPDPSCLKLNSVEHQEAGRVLIAAAAFGSVAYCPACHHASHSLHSRYSRTLHDLPWQGSTVQLRLEVRRFRCRAHDCPRVTFAETLPAVSVKYGRQTSPSQKCPFKAGPLLLLDQAMSVVLRRDEKAVNAAVILPWSNGQVEGQIHRLKLVERQMYGRAKFNLVRRRVLPYVAAALAVSPQGAP